MKRFLRWTDDWIIDHPVLFSLALVMCVVIFAVIGSSIFPDSTAEHRDLCRGLNGQFVDGGKYGDDACFGPDGRLVKTW